MQVYRKRSRLEQKFSTEEIQNVICCSNDEHLQEQSLEREEYAYEKTFAQLYPDKSS